MKQPRTFDEHSGFFAEFARRVVALDQAAWRRIEQRCAAIDDNSIFSIIDRARLQALPYDLYPDHHLSKAPAKVRIPFQLLSGAIQASYTSIFLGWEVAQQFPAFRDAGLKPRRRSTGKIRTDKILDAHIAIDGALAARPHYSPGVHSAIRAAGMAVLRHDYLDDDDFARCYFGVTHEIPFVELEFSANRAEEFTV